MCIPEMYFGVSKFTKKNKNKNMETINATQL